MKVEIINIGDELLIGQVVNTNASWLADQLTLNGFSVGRILTVSDNIDDILSAFREGFLRSDILLVSGGLGPTSDDLTREALCRFFSCNMRSDEDSLETIKKIFGRRNWPLTAINIKQAEVPEKCKAVSNPIGTSPGMWFEENGKILVAMPGVPFEMKQMVSEIIIPRLKEKFGQEKIVYRNILTHGLGESSLAERIKDWETDLPPQITLAYLPQPGIVRLRIMTKGNDEEEMLAMINKQIEKLKSIIPELIFGYDQDTMESIIGELLLNKNAYLSTAESCTGGYISHLITSVPGSSRYFKGSIVSYDNNVKIQQLGVRQDDIINYGAVSKQVVTQMAENVRKELNTDYSIAISGIAGPDGGTTEKPVGTTWIAVATPENTIVKHFIFGDNRERNIRRAALTALNMLRMELLS
jgi:nicotinamide-nucleotide amidase